MIESEFICDCFMIINYVKYLFDVFTRLTSHDHATRSMIIQSIWFYRIPTHRTIENKKQTKPKKMVIFLYTQSWNDLLIYDDRKLCKTNFEWWDSNEQSYAWLKRCRFEISWFEISIDKISLRDYDYAPDFFDPYAKIVKPS